MRCWSWKYNPSIGIQSISRRVIFLNMTKPANCSNLGSASKNGTYCEALVLVGQVVPNSSGNIQFGLFKKKKHNIIVL